MVDAIALAIGIVGALLTVASILVPIFALHYSRKWRKQDDMAAEQRQIVYRQDKDESRRKDKDARLERLLERFDHGGVHTARSQLNAYKAAHPDGALWWGMRVVSAMQDSGVRGKPARFSETAAVCSFFEIWNVHNTTSSHL